MGRSLMFQSRQLPIVDLRERRCEGGIDWTGPFFALQRGYGGQAAWPGARDVRAPRVYF